ncbi:hypothetical protein [Polaromonas sp.]|uniref:hypothetical protein n=1 Tax=Polaromonas sp. TaxID=1869339 RepID=UPI003561B54A
MTPSTKPVTRETSAFVRDGGRVRAVVATIAGGCLELRLKGTRQRETVELSGLWHQAVKARVWLQRMEKKAARAARRK